MPPLRDTVIPFRAGDGFECNLIHVEGDQPAAKGPVLLVHGAGVRANIFRAPTPQNVVAFLINNGYDVWLENWRASIDLPPNHWTLDQAAVYDHPVAVRTVAELTGASEVKAVIHCQGSTSFTMSAVAGLLPQVKTIISNAVSLHTVVPGSSAFKIKYALPFIQLANGLSRPRNGGFMRRRWLPRPSISSCNSPTMSATILFARKSVSLTAAGTRRSGCTRT